MTIPTTKEITEQNLANFEGQLGQAAPINEKAFVRVLSAEEAVLFASLYRFGIDRVKQILVTTATGDGLDVLGGEYGVLRKVAVAANLQITLPGINGTIIPAGSDFVGDPNGVRYRSDSSATVVGGIATIDVTANDVGTIGNLNDGDTLTIGTQVAGAETVATVLQTNTVGAEQENDENYRIRILDVVRAPGGGGNAADYRNWAQEVVGVKRAYPYSGQPLVLLGAGSPPDRVVFVESTTDVDPDGIPPQALLDQVRVSITTDPATGFSRQPLGLTDETLFVEAITRTSFFVVIQGLIIDPLIEAQVKTDIETQITNYFLGLQPFIDGVDAVIERNDLITVLTISKVIQDILSAAGGSAQKITFSEDGLVDLLEYQLTQGEMAKLEPGGISYV